MDAAAGRSDAAAGAVLPVGVLTRDQTVVLRDALLTACEEVHVDAAGVLARCPDASPSLASAWLRTSPSTDGGDLESHVAVALFWGLFKDERRRSEKLREDQGKNDDDDDDDDDDDEDPTGVGWGFEAKLGTTVSAEDDCHGVVGMKKPKEKKKRKKKKMKKEKSGVGGAGGGHGDGAVTVTSSFGVQRRLVPVALAAAIAEALPRDARETLLVDSRPAPGDSGVLHLTTRTHYETMRANGLLRCQLCGKFVAGDRALWWHQKTRHGVHLSLIHI